MNDIPGGDLLVYPSFSLGVVSETIENYIPRRPELRYKERLSKGYPNIVNDEVSALKFFYLKVLGLSYRFRVILEALEQGMADR